MGWRDDMRMAKLELGMSDMEDLVRRARSYRRFDEADRVGEGFLMALVDLARRSASSKNLQPLSYAIVSDAEGCERIFGGIRWAQRLSDWDGPEVGERPTGYVVVCSREEPTPVTWVDVGIACQTLVLAATAAGAGACMIRAFDGRLVREVVPELAEGYVPLLLVAVGVPAETVVLETARTDDPADLAYWRGPDGVHHVPKRSIESVLINREVHGS